MTEDVVRYEAPADFSLTVHRSPGTVIEEARQAAAELQKVVAQKKRPVIINNEQYLEFEDWQTVAKFYGVTAKIRSTQYVQYGDAVGFEATADAVHIKTGQAISTAESMCLNDESKWKDRDLFQLKSMAQTRAAAKALRNVFAWVVVLAGYNPTPAEDMTGTETVNGKQPIQQPKAKGPAPAGNGKELTAREKLMLELAQYCPDPTKRSAVLKELSVFTTEQNKERWLGLNDISNPKTSEKWIGKTLGKLRDRIAEEKAKAPPANVPADCPKDPSQCNHSKWGADSEIYCQDTTKRCAYTGGGDDVPL